MAGPEGVPSPTVERPAGALVPAPAAPALERALRTLTDDGVLTAEQASRLWQAALDDRNPAEPDGSGRRGPRRRSTGVLDVLGYLGGALLLGALVFVGFTLWGDLSRAGRTAVAVASFVVPAAAGAVLETGRTRRGLGRVLLALACVAAGSACFLVFDDRDLMVSTGVVVATAATGAAVLRSAVFSVPGWLGAMAIVPALAANGLGLREGDAVAYALAVGWLLVGLLVLAAGLALGRNPAWVLAGVSGWAATVPLLALEHSALALLVATLVAAALFVGVVRLQTYAFAVVACLVVLSIWPAGLYQALGTALGVALGLVAAGGVLIASAVLLARRHRRRG